MKKSIYVLLIVSFALIVTLIGVYYFNKSQMNQKPQTNSDVRKNDELVAPEKKESISNDTVGDLQRLKLFKIQTLLKIIAILI